MNQINTYGFRESSDFVGTTQQINTHMDWFRDSNERAINEQTDRLEAIISAQTVVQHEDAVEHRKNQTTLFSNLIKAIKSIFSSSDENETESFYDMTKRENDETQSAITGHTATTSEKLANIVNELQDLESGLQSNTEESKNIKNAISNLKLVVNNNITK
jgi:K+/H+ antiporter YhaU regulatory subunit KhtT